MSAACPACLVKRSTSNAARAAQRRHFVFLARAGSRRKRGLGVRLAGARRLRCLGVGIGFGIASLPVVLVWKRQLSYAPRPSLLSLIE